MARSVLGALAFAGCLPCMSFPVLLFSAVDFFLFSIRSPVYIHHPHPMIPNSTSQSSSSAPTPLQQPAHHCPISLHRLSAHGSDLAKSHSQSPKLATLVTLSVHSESNGLRHHPATISLHAEILYASLNTVPTYDYEAPATLSVDISLPPATKCQA